ncbi:alanyl-tRNA editing protein [uncultured Roseicyclus sp.]|jgi:misacylated tRNA(Ala) deacylase|uniref:alanyl-tRNA editing protein n=1 Tax=uncultured Roseicyclus sp. TaxID=543072 RepID=UPI00260C886F|nr:alanyl-tRNA editing protein [uncultured Roseicyclus sp.]
MTEPLFVAEPYRKSATARVIAQTDEGGLILDRTIFYARGGGQPGDSGTLDWEGGRIAIATTIKGDGGAIILVPAEPCILPPVGAETEHRLDWHLRYGHMRIHTALHLLSVVLPYPVTGGAIGHDKGRLDFDMPDSPDDPAVIEGRLNAFVTRDLPVSADWISEAELDANPGLVKTMSVQPPRGAGRIRLIRIGAGSTQVDLQPCGGTHVARTGEIGKLVLGKIEKKGRLNRRVTIALA